MTIDKYDEDTLEFEYNLRFNITNPSRIDHIDTREDLKIPFKIDDKDEFYS